MDNKGIEASALEVDSNATIIYRGVDRGFCHAFASTSNCSQRSQLGKRVADECLVTISQIQSTLEKSVKQRDCPSEKKKESRSQRRAAKKESNARFKISNSSITKISRSVKDRKLSKDRKWSSYKVQMENLDLHLQN